jgi:guanosine-3',5'-bis(diphosphate) 3'-pyrophosphohydrolase
MRDTNPARALLYALEFAAEKHRDQRRKGVDASPYINHAIRVARLLADVGAVSDIDILQAAVLHDTLEDTRTTGDELEVRFGPAVRRLVEEVTDDKRLPDAERKRLQIVHAGGLSDGARLIKIADKIANVVDVGESPPHNWSLARRIAYLEWAEAVVERCRGSNLMLEEHWDVMRARARAHIDPTTNADPGEVQ